MSYTDFATAKINLTQRVIGRRAVFYHELESLVVFADVGDRLTFTPGNATTLDVAGPFATVCGLAADNLVLKGAAALAARVPGLHGGAVKLEKNLPVASGIGGGKTGIV